MSKLINTGWFAKGDEHRVQEDFPIGKPVLCDLTDEIVTASEHRWTGAYQTVNRWDGGSRTYRKVEVWGTIEPAPGHDLTGPA